MKRTIITNVRVGADSYALYTIFIPDNAVIHSCDMKHDNVYAQYSFETEYGTSQPEPERVPRTLYLIPTATEWHEAPYRLRFVGTCDQFHIFEVLDNG